MIRFIMKLTGGPTNPKNCVEFTSWPSVDRIAARIVELHAGGA
jgi:menaquinone-dependent protoporphyrinogen IX oxidase